ncbi:alpha-2A adrenergic receptor-like [Mya arenaria]|uniref:alpha-2A adrenergic receptor-like n=1 Tax=Mya arenaria TaxID=6604 RepID=UPI0022E7F31B|nr:alpha-2A adrenergic receptor-like [Mya arenaria]
MSGTNISYSESIGPLGSGMAINESLTDRNDILLRMNKEKVILLLPVIVYVFVCIVAGIIGNVFVCYIYTHRLRRSPSRIFILFLAMLDLISCIVGAGSELSDLFQPLVFTATWSCKILRFGLSFTIISASFTLICVAFDRYYKVCKPLDSFPIRKIKNLCIIVAVLSLVLSSPALGLFGLKTVNTDVNGITGSECSTADDVRGTPLPIAYYVILFTAFVVLLTCFVLLYVRIGIEIWKRKRLTIGETLPTIFQEIKQTPKVKYTRNNSVQADDMSSPSCQTDDESRGHSESRAGCENPAISESEATVVSTMNRNIMVTQTDSKSTLRPKPLLKRRKSNLGRMSIRTVRTTSIFFAVSAAFVVSFLPYLIVNVLKFTKIAFHELNNSTEEVVYNLCVRSYFLSNFINPIIYSALNNNFRKECKKLLKRTLKNLKSCCICQKQ